MDYSLPEEGAETSTDSEPRCRLCLQWTDEEDDADRGFQNIFTEDDESLPFKIRDCLGVFVSPEDSIRTICTNCRQTVCLIDEFRTLCRQTEEIYESVQIRYEDSERWERYGEYVGELRRLVQEHKDTINEQLVGVEGVEGTADEDSISQQFVPMLLVKEEPDDNEEDWGDEPMAMEVLDIKPDRPSTDESDEEVDENNEAEPSDGIGSTSYEQQVKLAQEVLKRLKQFTSTPVNHKELWAEIAEQLEMAYSATRTRWNRMKQSYLATKAGVATGTRLMILRLKGCALFNLMNQIVPELDDSVEPWVAPDSVDTDERTDGKNFPIGLKIAIAEEVKNNPDLWDRSLASSTHTMDQTWKSIARKFNMDVINLRLHWRSLQGIYRTHKKRVREGARVRTKADTQFYKLIEILHHIYQTNEGGVVKQEQEPEQVTVEEEKEENVLVVLKEHQEDEDTEDKTKKKDDTPVSSQKMTLAKLVYKHQHLWNQKHQDFHNAVARDATWNRIAVTLNKTREEAKYAWKCLRDLYRGRVKRLKQGLLHPEARVLHEPLFKQLELMFAGNMRIGPIPPVTGPPQPAAAWKRSAHMMDASESDEAPEGHGDGDTVEDEGDENMKLAVLCEKHQIIWNSKHPDHANLEKRDIVWDSIARKMNLTRVQAKAVWTRLRNVYRGRRLRLLKGNLAKNSHLLRDPLYRKLNTMLKDHMHLGKYGGGISKSESSEQTKDAGRGDAGPFPTMEDKVRLVEEVIKYQFLWNATHPDFHNAVARDETWKRIAVSMNQSSTKIKYAYKLLRDSYRSRMKRMLQSNTDLKAHFEYDPLFQKMNMMFSKSMRIDLNLKAASRNSAHMADESESNDVLEDHGDGDTVEYDIDETLKLAVLCEKNELIWNSKHPNHQNFEKRDAVWDTIAQEMNVTKAYVKELWTRLRNIYRTRRLRYLQGSITKRNHLLCDPLYRKLHAMLDGHMQLGKHGGGFPKKDVPLKEPGEVGPFSTMEDKVRLVEEVFKHEHLWNTTHVDYFKSDKRGAMWSQIAGMFDNCDAWAARSEWRRLRNMHRPRKSRAAAVYEPIDDNEEDEPMSSNPLYDLFSKMAESLTAENEGDPAEEGEPSGATHTKKVKKRRIQEITEAYMTHKRRFTGKRSFDDEGCIKVTKGGIVRYEKICELCGKQIERSYFEYHMNQHNGLKPYICSFEGCGRQYSNKITRDRHEVLVHCDEGYKYECDQCDEKFKYRSTFDYHYAIKHESQKVPCTVCGKLLKHKSLLREHLRRHTGHFPCNVCGKILQKKYSLDVHMRTHTNEKPYPCELCGQCFMLKVQMKTHLAKAHQLSWEEFQEIYGSTSQQ
ncbi:uncharacterized protein LOC135712271 isoform X1 [Ochlerotatus camptorhynchus]|uniref:uncharacterized protein LOC135712271 isoform X1 n=1 Tax=Ochlerotatus camptorhynchus TaxID=644619 RepID=UPI0031DFA185